MRYHDAKQFYEVVRPAFAQQEVENSLFLGLAKRLGQTGEAGLMIALRDGEAVEAAALRLPPYELSICAASMQAVDRLVEAVREIEASIPSVVGLTDRATRFADGWMRKCGGSWRTQLDLTLYVLMDLMPPPSPASGSLRQADQQDAAWLIDWNLAFAVEARLPGIEHDRAQAMSRLRESITNGRRFVWEDSGRPVAMASFAPTGMDGARIGGVYTLPAERGRGYAGAAVAALSRRLLDASAARWCSLFADVSNPQSNRIYQRFGYREACRFRSIRLRAVQEDLAQ